MNRFEPWIGRDYTAGIGGVRLLVLGESHWGNSTYQYTEFTRDVVKKWCFQRRDRFFTSIAKLVLGIPPGVYLAEGPRQAFWNQVAFYNFVPVIVGPGPRDRPSEAQWSLATEPFCNVLTELEPHAILVLGKELWWHLPEPDSMIRLPIPSMEIEIKRYRRGATFADAVMIQHPSSFGMRYADWRPRVQLFLGYVAKRPNGNDTT